MNEATIQVVANVAQVVLLAIVAALVKAWTDRQTTHNAASFEKLKEVANSAQDTKVILGELEKNTNSMKDALVKVTGEKEFAKGVKQGTIEEQARGNVTDTPKP